MKKQAVVIQERGLMLLIGVAVLTSGLLLFTDQVTTSHVSFPAMIHLQHVQVLLPDFVERMPVNINSATSDELITLPGIGPALAQRIIEERRENGPFGTVEDLVRVSGIGPKTVEGLVDCAVASPTDI
ncbi:ComEA family DNA-binding protein [Candidatus Bipolaricaulota bacterium]|nr:ComEA family DNA-binding protein [Candidatus Bipolaricaulota bacterium]